MSAVQRLLKSTTEPCQMGLAVLPLLLPSPFVTVQLLQTTNNSPMNSKPQQIKMQSTKKGAVTKREEGVPPLGMAAGGPPAGDEAPSTAAAPPTPTALQPSVSEGKSISCSCWQFRLDLRRRKFGQGEGKAFHF